MQMRRLMLVALIVGVRPMAAQPDDRVTVAVLGFDSSNVRKWWSWTWDIGDGLGDLVTEALVSKGSYRVLERAQMKRILGEQDFGRSGRVDESRAVEIGKLLGARLVIFGTLSEFDYASTGGVRIAGIGISGSKARTKLNGRIVDAQTGETLGAVVGEGEESGATLSVNTYRGISFSSKEIKNSTVGKSVDKAVAAFADAAAIKIDEVGSPWVPYESSVLIRMLQLADLSRLPRLVKSAISCQGDSTAGVRTRVSGTAPDRREST